MRGELISMETLKIMKAIEIENKDLQERIEKAINYIEQEEWNTEYDKKLLSILKGEKNEKARNY